MTWKVSPPSVVVGGASRSLASTYTGVAFEPAIAPREFIPNLSGLLYLEIDVDPATVTFTMVIAMRPDPSAIWITSAGVTQASAWTAGAGVWTLQGLVAIAPMLQFRIVVAALSGTVKAWMLT